jgi:hypothetical protein
MQCENCTNPRICTLIDKPEIGWCQECNFCNLCKNAPCQYRVEWDVQCQFELRLCRDVCENCLDQTPNPEDCACAKTSHNRTVHEYSYSENKMLHFQSWPNPI